MHVKMSTWPKNLVFQLPRFVMVKLTVLKVIIQMSFIVITGTVLKTCGSARCRLSVSNEKLFAMERQTAQICQVKCVMLNPIFAIVVPQKGLAGWLYLLLA